MGAVVVIGYSYSYSHNPLPHAGLHVDRASLRFD